jgi:UDP-perosamine 4-acetyltransferase
MALPVVGLGAGGHAKVVVEILSSASAWEVVGLLDTNRQRHGTLVLGVPVLGADDCLPILYARGLRHFFVGLGSAGKSEARARLYALGQGAGFEAVVAVHPRAVVSPHARLGAGCVVCAAAVVNPEASVGVNCIINTAAIVEHDVRLGNHVHVGPGACLAGGALVGDGSHIGAAASVKQGLRIGSGSVVGMGAVVLRDVPDRAVVVGVPARMLERPAAERRTDAP